VKEMETDRSIIGATYNIARQQRKTVLAARNLCKAFDGQVVLDGIDLSLQQGEVVLLRGENGSGKTTLLNILTGNLEPDSGGIEIKANGCEETFTFPKPWWRELNPFDHFTPERLAWDGVGRVWQDIRLFPTMKTLENVVVASPATSSENPLRALLPSTYRQEKRNKQTALEWLAKLGLAGRIDSSCDKISLGQMKRVAIARAIQAGAKVLFLDEPLSGLDEEGMREVTAYLRSVVDKNSITLVIVEHVFNISRILDLADTVWTLSRGKLTTSSDGDYRESEKGTTVFYDLLREVAGDDGVITHEKLPDGAKIASVFHGGSRDAPSVLDIKGLRIKRGMRTIFDEGLSFSLQKGQLSILEAPNGWGKSSLLDAVAGIQNGTLRIESGSVTLNGRDVGRLQTHQRIKMGLAYLRSNQQVFASLTLREQKKLAASEGKEIFDGLLNMNVRGSVLSGGEKQRLLVDLLPPAADVYLLDEPMIGFDGKSVDRVRTMICRLVKRDSCILITIPCQATAAMV